MKQAIQGMILSLSLSGLLLAANNTTTQPTNTINITPPSKPNTAEKNTAPRTGTIVPSGSAPVEKNTDTRDGTIAPNSGSPRQNSSDAILPGYSQINGTVTSIDQNGNRVRVKDAQGNITEVAVTDKTQFINNNKKIKFSDIKAGDSVTFGY